MVKALEIPKTFRSTYASYKNSDLEIMTKSMHTLYDNTHKILNKKQLILNELHKISLTKRLLLLDTKKIAKSRKGLPVLLGSYQDDLAKTNPVLFYYLTDEQRVHLKNKLLYSYFLLFAQFQLDASEGREYTLEKHQDDLDLCSKRIQELDLSQKIGKKVDYQKALQSEINLFTKCLYYLGLTILAQWFVERIQEFMECKTGAVINWLTEINTKRLYWVWGGGMLASALDLMPSTFLNTKDASQTLALPSPVCGYISFVLYFFRFGINLFLLLGHTIEGPWMSEEESKTPAWERFKTQWDQRKFTLLNDLIWGTINMVCFFWLYGRGMLGYAGNLVTVVLLSMDLILSIWRHWEETTKHEAQMLALEKDKATLTKKLEEHRLVQTQNWLTSEKKWQTEQAELDEQIKDIDKRVAKAKFEWKYKDLSLLNDCCYAFALVISFCVVACFLFPPTSLAPLTVLIIGLCGAAACFLVTTISTGVGAYLDVAKSQEQRKMSRDECAKLLSLFKNADDPKIKKQLYIQMKALMAESDSLQEFAKFQMIKGARSVIIDALFPLVVFLSLVFLPTGVGLGIIGAVLAIAIISYAIMNQYEPEAAKLPEYNKSDYKKFLEKPTLSHFELSDEKEGIKTIPRFFNSEYLKIAQEDNLAFGEVLVIN
ncbi:MAG: hypothetical protein H0U73_12025 [Tatlockia sp.]|nr:hypothetical protein [Tatlockia sp.]